MAKVETHTCDDCGREAPRGHATSFPKAGWIGLFDSAPLAGFDFCSAACLAAWANRLSVSRLEVVITNRGEVDELEALLATPAATKPRKKAAPRRKPPDAS